MPLQPKQNMTDALTTAYSRLTFGDFIKDMLTGMLDLWTVTAYVYKYFNPSPLQILPP